MAPYMPWIGFVWLMGHMSISHIYRQMLNDPSIIDITGAQMVMVMKLNAFCWNVWDGKQKLADLSDAQKGAHADRFARGAGLCRVRGFLSGADGGAGVRLCGLPSVVEYVDV